MTRSPYRRPDLLLDELGVSEPEEIRIEAIAQACGATVVYEPMVGADARILGVGDRAIITVDAKAQRPRQRFSAAHELGHWLGDRGRIAYSCEDRALLARWGDRDDPESRANRFAADLLLPKKLVASRARGIRPVLDGVRDLARIFETSITATAIRLVELGTHPAMVVCSGPAGRRWFVKSELVPAVLRPTAKPGPGSTASALLAGGRGSAGPVTVDADDWVEHQDSADYVVEEDSIMVAPDLVLSLIWWKNERQILDIDGDD